MEPALRPGEWLLVSYRRRPRPGDVVVARFADGTLAVKRAVEVRRTRSDGPGWWLLSDRPDVGVDSRHRGVVPEEEVYAVALRIVHPVHRLLCALRRRGGPAGTIPA